MKDIRKCDIFHDGKPLSKNNARRAPSVPAFSRAARHNTHCHSPLPLPVLPTLCLASRAHPTVVVAGNYCPSPRTIGDMGQQFPSAISPIPRSVPCSVLCSVPFQFRCRCCWKLLSISADNRGYGPATPPAISPIPVSHAVSHALHTTPYL
jgi:hypothetical protein